MSQPAQEQEVPGTQSRMSPVPDCGENSYRGSGKAAVITGGDSGIGRAVAIAFAREGADVLISYLSEDEGAEDSARLAAHSGRKVVLDPGEPQLAGEGHRGEWDYTFVTNIRHVPSHQGGGA